MEDSAITGSLKRLSDGEFLKLSELVNNELGIKMPPAKRSLLESRLQKRLRALGLASFAEYCDYLFSPRGMDGELVSMLDLVTTNKTDFFREAHHFEFMTKAALPHVLRTTGPAVSVWSAGCSTGEEPYTIAMVLSEYARLHPGEGLDYSILATDISTRVLEMASKGIYKEDRIKPVPEDMKKRYLLRSRDPSKGLVRVSPELRGRISFERLNFMDDEFPVEGNRDFVFCRNVIIYFDKETQEQVLSRLCGRLRPGGFLFIGHSETLSGMDLPLKKVSTSVYLRL